MRLLSDGYMPALSPGDMRPRTSLTTPHYNEPYRHYYILPYIRPRTQTKGPRRGPRR